MVKTSTTYVSMQQMTEELTEISALHIDGLLQGYENSIALEFTSLPPAIDIYIYTWYLSEKKRYMNFSWMNIALIL